MLLCRNPCIAYQKLCCGLFLVCHHVHLVFIVVGVHSDWFPGFIWLLVLVYFCLHLRVHIVPVLHPNPWFPIISLVYFPCSPCFPIIYCTSSKILEYCILLSPVMMTPYYRFLLIIFLLTVTMTSDRWCTIIICCGGSQSSQCTYHHFTRLVPSTPILVSSHHARCCDFSLFVRLIASIYAVNNFY